MFRGSVFEPDATAYFGLVWVGRVPEALKDLLVRLDDALYKARVRRPTPIGVQINVEVPVALVDVRGCYRFFFRRF